MRAVALALIAVMGLAACVDPLTRCEDAHRSKRYEDAAVRCDAAFERQGTARPLYLGAWARFQLKRDGEVLDAAKRLSADPRAGGLLLVAGQVEERRQNLADARAYFHRALEREQQAANPAGASRAAYALFRSHWASTELRPALQFARRALAEAEQAHDASLTANALLAVTSILLEVGDAPGARRTLAASKSVPGIGEVERAHLLFQEARLARAEAQAPLAAARHRQLLAQPADARWADLRFGAAVNLLELSLESGALEEAERQLEVARATLPAGAQNGAIALWHATAQLRRAKGDAPQAAAALDAAEALKPKDGWRWRLSLERGRVHELAGRTSDAMAAYAEAAQRVESLRGELQLDDLKAWLLAQKREPLERLFLLQAAQRDARAALETTERALARTFLDAHVRSTSLTAQRAADAVAPGGDGEKAAADTATRDGVGGSEAPKREEASPGANASPSVKSLISSHARPEREGASSSAASSPRSDENVPPPQASPAAPALAAADSQRSSPDVGQEEPAVIRADSLRALFPSLRASPLVAPAPIDDVLAALKQDSALVYFEAQGTLWLMVALRGEVTLTELGKAAALSDDLDRLRRNPDDLQAADALGQALLPAPARAVLHPSRTTFLASNGQVSRIPFAALRLNGRYLADLALLCNVPSLTALRAIRTSESPVTGAPVALADANGDLPAARAEGELLRTRTGARVAVGASATRAALLAAGRAPLLHLAVHSGLSPRGAWLSLAGGDVWADEVLEAHLRPRTVVLSSCASAAAPGEEMWGSLSSAFLAAGSRTVIASLWSVKDDDTRRFMDELYRSPPQDSPAAALARAQRALIRDGHPPSRWAAFLAMGDCT